MRVVIAILLFTLSHCAHAVAVPGTCDKERQPYNGRLMEKGAAAATVQFTFLWDGSRLTRMQAGKVSLYRNASLAAIAEISEYKSGRDSVLTTAASERAFRRLTELLIEAQERRTVTGQFIYPIYANPCTLPVIFAPKLDDPSQTPLMRAVQVEGMENDSREFAGLREILKDPRQVNERDQSGASALLYAVRAGQTSAIINELLKAGADPNVSDRNGVTPLMEAVAKGNQEVVLKLIEAGSHVDAQDNLGDTALIRAAFGSAALVSDLLRAGARVNLADKYGSSAIFSAIRAGDLESVQLLINSGADLKLRDWTGRTPLEFAQSGKYGRHQEIVQVLQSAEE